MKGNEVIEENYYELYDLNKDLNVLTEYYSNPNSNRE